MRIVRKPVDFVATCIDNDSRSGTLWSALTTDEVARFNRTVICRQYDAGETVFNVGDPCLGLYFVHSGLVGVRKADAEGQSALVRLATRGNTLGYRPFLARQPHRATAEVLKAARVCFLPGEEARKLIEGNHQLGLNLLERTARAMGDTEERLFHVAALNVEVRVAHLLLLLHERWGRRLDDGSAQIELPVKRQDLASMVGARPETLSRAIRQLESQGLVRFEGRHVHIDRFDRLAERLHGEMFAGD